MRADYSWSTTRELSEREPCEYCTASPGDTCRDPRTGRVLMGQPAHLVRQKRAGVAATPCLSAAYKA